MGLFSKKTYTCKRCGKTFETRLGFLGVEYCDECNEIVAELDRYYESCSNYTNEVLRRDATKEEKQYFVAHKDDLLEKYRMSYEKGGTVDIDTFTINMHGHNTYEVAYPFRNGCVTKFFTALGGKLDGIVIDNADVYMIAYEVGQTINGDISAVNLMLFTNDPRFPIVPLVDAALMRPLTADKKRYLEKLDSIIKTFYPGVVCAPVRATELPAMARTGRLSFDQHIIKAISRDAYISAGLFSDYKKLDVTEKIEERLRDYGYVKVNA